MAVNLENGQNVTLNLENNRIIISFEIWDGCRILSMVVFLLQIYFPGMYRL